MNYFRHIFRYIKPRAVIYYSYFIRPILETCPSILYSISKTDSSKIEKLQNRIIKLISGKKFNQHENTTLSQLRSRLNLPLLSSRRSTLFLNKTFKTIHNQDIILASHLHITETPSHSFNLRNYQSSCNTLIQPKYKKN